MAKQQVHVFPNYQSSWTVQMKTHLTELGISGKYPNFQQWLVQNTLGLCRSWGDRGKSYAPRNMIVAFVDDQANRLAADAIIEDWSRGLIS